MSQKELSKEPPPDALEETTQKDLSIHHSDNDSLMDPKDVAQHMWENTHTKWHQEYEVGSGTRSGMKDQLQRVIKVVTNSFMTMRKEIQESNHEEFDMVRDRLDSIFYIVSKRTYARPMMQYIQSITTEPQDRNMQFPPNMIDIGNGEIHQLLWPILSVALDLNIFSTMTLVELQHVATLELVEQ